MIKTHIDADYERFNTFWYVTLNTGETIYQWDADETGQFVNSWMELKSYLEFQDIQILSMGIKFRDHHELVASGAEGYFFVYSMMANLADGSSDNFLNCGYLENGVVHTKRWKIPELIYIEAHERDPNDEFTSKGLIVN